MFSLRASAITLSGLLGLTSACTVDSDKGLTLINFTDISEDVTKWVEVSDTVRSVGKSKGAIVRVNSQPNNPPAPAIFFSLLIPQPDGSGFAGVRLPVSWNLTCYWALTIRVRAYGENRYYKISLRHKGLNSEPFFAYETLFIAPVGEFDVVVLPLSNFSPYFRGRLQSPSKAEPLSKSEITAFEFQIIGGVYSTFKQRGVSALEIASVVAI